MTTKTSWRDVLKIHPAADEFPMMPLDELKILGEVINQKEKMTIPVPIVLWCKGECPKDKRGRYDPDLAKAEDISLLDGRNRLDAMEAVGLRIEVRKGGILMDVYKTVVVDEDEVLDPERPPLADGTQYIPFKKGDEYEDFLFEIRPTILFEEEELGKGTRDPYVLADSLNLHRRHLTAEQRRERIGKRLKANPEMSDRAIAKEVGSDHKTVSAKREKLEATGEIPQLMKRVGGDGKARAMPAEPKPPVEQAQPVHPSNAAEPPPPCVDRVEEIMQSFIAMANELPRADFDRLRRRIHEYFGASSGAAAA